MNRSDGVNELKQLSGGRKHRHVGYEPAAIILEVESIELRRQTGVRRLDDWVPICNGSVEEKLTQEAIDRNRGCKQQDIHTALNKSRTEIPPRFCSGND
jgi:hypothetical protein